MSIDAKKVFNVFEELGKALSNPATLCLIGSTPGIAEGQLERQTSDLDVWMPRSTFARSDLERACAAAGILFNPLDDPDPDKVYVQLVRPGIVNLPAEFEPEVIGQFGMLTVVMPPPEIIAAAKLVRASALDVADVVWWIKQRGLDPSDIQFAIDRLPNQRNRETATENMILVELVMGRTS